MKILSKIILLIFVDCWIIGFINGEGSFYVVKNGKVHRFVIEHTDKKALEIIKEHITLKVKVSTVTIRGNRKQTYSISATAKEDITKVFNFIDKNNLLQGYKLEQYNKFKESFLIKKKS